MTRHERPRNHSTASSFSVGSNYGSDNIAPTQVTPQVARNPIQVPPKPRSFSRDQSVSPGSQMPSSPPTMSSPNAFNINFDHRSELSVLSFSQRNSPPRSVSPSTNGRMSAVTPSSAVSNNGGVSGDLAFFSDSNDHSEKFQLSPQFRRPGSSTGTPNTGVTIGPDSYFPDSRRPSVASLVTNASSTGSKTSIGRSGRSFYKRFFGDDNSNESPGSSESLAGNRELPRPNPPYARPGTPTSLTPETPLPPSTIVPFLYQHFRHVKELGEAPVQPEPVGFDGSDDPPQPSSSSYRLHLGRRKDKDKDKGEREPGRPNTKDSFFNSNHRKELGKIDGITSSHSSQSKLERPSSPTPSVASSVSNSGPKSPGPPPKKSIFHSLGFSKRKKEENDRGETPQPIKVKHPEPIQTAYKYEAVTPKRDSASAGTTTSVTAEYQKYVHPSYVDPRILGYGPVDEQKQRRNITATVPPPTGKKMKRGHSNESGGRKLLFINKGKTEEGGEANVFRLDTDLDDMIGIIDGHNTTPFEVTTFLTPEEPSKPANFPNLSATAADASWKAPDSWQYEPAQGDRDKDDTEGSSEDNPGVIDTIGDSQRRPSAQFCIRVFRADSTFATLSCNLTASVTEVLKLLGRKPFIQDDLSNYQIILKKGELSRILGPNERPLLIQKRLLEQAGYTEHDHLEEVGREDHSYLCRFTFRMSRVGGCSLEADPGLGRLQRFNHVELQGKSLFTIPITLYQKAADIISLNLSSNLSIDVPKDFIQACTNLRKIEFQGNEAHKLPASISYASRLTYLDISNNRLESLDHAQLDRASSLVSLKMANNRLTSLPAEFSKFKSLRNLHIASNNLSEFPKTICELVTLVTLDISFNSISSIPSEIGQLCALERFIATNNCLAGSLPDTFANLGSLKELDVRYNQLTNIDIVADLPRVELVLFGHNSVSALEKSFSKIRALHLNSNPVTRFSVPWSMPSLTYLNISSAKITNLVESVFDQLPNLQKLVLDKNHIISFPHAIWKLRKLEHLSCYNNKLARLPTEIGQLTELKYLDLHENNLKELPPTIWHLSMLQTLNLSSNILRSLPKPTANPNTPAPAPGADTPSSSQKSDPDELLRLDTGTDASRRPSQASGGLLSPPVGNGTIAAIPITTMRKDSSASHKLANTIAQSLHYLHLADNRLTDEVFEEVSLLSELRLLNLSYNEIYDIPPRALSRMPSLNELYLSGNELTSLPADDLEHVANLKVLHLNGNKFQTLPAELGKIRRLLVLDVGTNSLKYNISNWPYDWNWNWNLDLKFLNLSGNKKLEIKPANSQSTMIREKSIADFSQLQNLRVLGLMDVTLTITQVPDQTEDRRVRTSASNVRGMPYGMADTLGRCEHLSIIDLVVPQFRGIRDECLLGLFDGQVLSSGGSKVAMFLQEHFTYYFNIELDRLRERETRATALRRTFLTLNKTLANTAIQSLDERSGRGPIIATTVLGPDDFNTGAVATVVYIAGNDMFVANVGDAMAVLVRTDGELKVLTKKHEPAFGAELERVREAGGFCSRNGKLNETLSVSRTFGYFRMMPAVQAAPHIHEVALSDQDELLIIGSQEVWEFVEFQAAVDIVRTEKNDLMRAAHKLRDFAIAYGATNKIMVMIIGVGDLRKAKHRMRAHSVSLNPNNYISGDELIPSNRRRKPTDDDGGVDDSNLGRLPPEVKAPEGEVSLVFTDIKNSTLLWETYPGAMRAAISVHNNIMRRELRIIGGYEVKTEGDAFIVCFPTVTSALLWCFSIQVKLLSAPWPAEITASEHGREIFDANGEVIYRGLSVRMGIHCGQPVCEPDPITRRMDYFGPMVNRTARISQEADGGQITASADFVSEIKRIIEGCQNPDDDAFEDAVMAAKYRADMGRLSTQGFEYKELGERKLKGLENPEFIYLMYPTYLAGRLIKKPNPKPPNSIDPEQLWQLWDISTRLEILCSTLATQGRAPKLTRLKDIAPNFKSPDQVQEAWIFPILEHVVTRIENSLSNLSIRQLLAEDGTKFQLGQLQDLLNALNGRLSGA